MIGTCPKSACLLLGHSCSHNRALRVGPYQPQGNSILRSPQLSSCWNLRYQLLISAAVPRGDQDAAEQRSSSRQNGPGGASGRTSSRTSGRGGRNTRGGRGARKSPDASEQEASTNYNPPIDPPRMKVNRASRRAAERELAAAETAERDSRGGSSSHELPTGQDHANGSDRLPVERRGGRGGRGRPSGRGGRGGRGRTSGAQNDGRRSMPPSQQKPAQPLPDRYRVSDIKVPETHDMGKDDFTAHLALRSALAEKLGCRVGCQIAEDAITVVRKSFDARKKCLTWVYCVDVDTDAVVAAGVRNPLRHPALQPRPEDVRPGSKKRSPTPNIASTATGTTPIDPWQTQLQQQQQKLARDPLLQGDLGLEHSSGNSNSDSGSKSGSSSGSPPVIVVGSGPAGLFAALSMAESGLAVTLLERGQPVEERGRDIGALFARSVLDPESNLSFGEGGAGTWSDGKLTTRIGRNDSPVRQVLQQLHDFGAPDSILVAGAPHLGTDKLVRILKAFRERLTRLGVTIRWGSCIKSVSVEDGAANGVTLQDGTFVAASRVVLATGHSSRPLLKELLTAGVTLTPKPFAMGFRVEHPQSLIDEMQYGSDKAQEVARGKGRIPVADYALAANISEGLRESRNIFSFCMCPGGQVVPTSISPDELCINGMSFSRRQSKWANSALVVGTQPSDWEHLVTDHGVLAGVELQREAERLAAQMGGGNMVCPVQRVTDFMEDRLSDGTLPSSSYRLGVKSAPLHALFSAEVTSALKQALLRFDRSKPGFITEDALLHGVETRTSCPVRINRGKDCESVSTRGLYPAGEGAGYAGGIVSAAVDGLLVGRAVAADMMSGCTVRQEDETSSREMVPC